MVCKVGWLVTPSKLLRFTIFWPPYIGLSTNVISKLGRSSTYEVGPRHTHYFLYPRTSIGNSILVFFIFL